MAAARDALEVGATELDVHAEMTLSASIAYRLEPGMRVSTLTHLVRSYYEEHGLWEDRGWVGG